MWFGAQDFFLCFRGGGRTWRPTCPWVFSPYKIKVATVHCWIWMVWNLRIFQVGRDPIRIIKSNSLLPSGQHWTIWLRASFRCSWNSYGLPSLLAPGACSSDEQPLCEKPFSNVWSKLPLMQLCSTVLSLVTREEIISSLLPPCRSFRLLISLISLPFSRLDKWLQPLLVNFALKRFQCFSHCPLDAL